jgi:hypothetical protein
MKHIFKINKLLSLSILLFISIEILACDICGCGIGGNYIGLLPDFQKNIIGMRYKYNHLTSHLGPNGVHTYLTTQEHYNTIELWGAWQMNKWRLSASLPYSFNERQRSTIVESKSGLADATILTQYNIYNHRTILPNDHLMVQSIWIGLGVKLPSGTYIASDNTPASQNLNLFQLGTGSTDILFSAMYDIRVQDHGFNVNANYKINGSNNTSYTYGNKFNVIGNYYFKIRVLSKYTLTPNIGLLYETSSRDNDGLFKVDVSGGHVLMGSLGCEIALGQFGIGTNYQMPMKQNLAKQIVAADDRLMLHGWYAF